MLNVTVTGSTGFVGRHLQTALTARNITFANHSRHASTAIAAGYAAVIHLAGRAHIMNDAASDPLAAFRAANCDYALTVAKQAVAAGVKRFVYPESVTSQPSTSV